MAKIELFVRFFHHQYKFDENKKMNKKYTKDLKLLVQNKIVYVEIKIELQKNTWINISKNVVQSCQKKYLLTKKFCRVIKSCR